MKHDLIRQFAAFLGVGALATACHYAVLLILVEFAGAGPVLASGMGATVGAVVSYGLNRTYTFHSTAQHRKIAPRFFTVASLAVGGNTALMWGLTGSLMLPYLLAQILTTGLLIVLTFGLNKLWAFRS